MNAQLHIIGGGMAGSEAAWQAAQMGVQVVLHEMRPQTGTFAHRTGDFAEMVCSNSFRSDDDERNAVGLLHWEMRAAGGLIMEMATRHRLPAGGALAVDRDPFAASVTERLRTHPNISVQPGEITALPEDGHWIIATGPLTSGALADSIRTATGAESLAFFDAIAPIVYAESVDMSVAWRQSRYDKGETEEERTAYLNCPMDKAQYEAFIDAMLAIRGEIDRVKAGEWPLEDNPLVNAPHTQGELVAEWHHPYTRELAVFPAGLANKYWPTVKRLDDVYGDRNLFCSCVPMSEYQ